MEQPRLKALAKKVLIRNKQWNNRAPTTEKTVGHPPQENPDLDTLLTEACVGVPGIDPAVFRTLLSSVDVEDIEGGHIPMLTLSAYARSFAEGLRCGRITMFAAAIPKPPVCARVRCTDCRHFERDTIGDGAGIGRCRVQGEGTTRYPALWANAERTCQDFEARAAS